MKLHEFLEILQSKTGKDAKRTASGYMACCPAHEDENPSLSLSDGQNGKILLHCFGGCPIETICDSLGLQITDLFDSSLAPPSASERKRIVYSYKDEHNQEIYRKIRIEPGFEGRAKTFYSERTDENGQIIKNLKGCRKVLYRLPEVMKGLSENKIIFLVEGEKDADKLFELGLVATTALESLKWSDEFTDILEGADAVILYDMDKTGLERRDLLCKNLHKKVNRLRVADLPGLEYKESHGSDVSDWLAMGHISAELLEIVSKTPDYSLPNEKGVIRSVSLGDFLDMKIPKREMLLSPFLPSQGLAMLYAKRGVGKTHVALGIAYAVARGGSFLKWTAPKARPVLFIDGEMPAIAMQERLHRIAVTDNSDPNTLDFLKLITPDLQDGPMPDLSSRRGRDSIEKFVENSDLIVIDNISSLFRSGSENEAESWQPAQEWGLEMRRHGKSILFVHHAGKSGQQRGTSKKEDFLDTVISLKHPPNYRADQGAQFEVIYEKTRHFAGEDAAPFQVQLREDKDGLWYWEIMDIEIDPDVVLITELTKKGYTIKQITEERNLSKSKVETLQKKARNLGLLD